jgi:hypothetical protein
VGDTAAPAPTPFSATVSDPWTSGVRRTPQLEFRVTTALLTADAAFLARAATAAGISGSLTLPRGFLVEIVDVDGLYKPDLAALPPAQGARKVAGYISDDNLGRIFTNRRPDGTWQRDTQYIDVKVKVSAFGGSTIPAGASIRWTVTDVDDPTNDAPDFHREAGRYVDANDYNASGNPIGAHPRDNALAHSPGNASESLLFGAAASGSATARWSQATGGPAVSPSSLTEARTPLSLLSPRTGTSSVRIHCPNVLGTNLVVKAELIGIPAAIPVHNAFTGVMTMWSRIDVEVVRMAAAHSVSGVLGRLPSFFRPVCVQLDFQLEGTVTGALDRAEMAASPNVLSTSTTAWVNNSGVFTHRGQGGWFFLGAARLPSPLPGASPPALFTGTAYALGTTGTDVWVEVAGSFASADDGYVKFTWTDLAGTTHNVGFGVVSVVVSGGNTRISLEGNDVTPDFTGHDANGSLAHAYASQIQFYPRHKLPAGVTTLAAGGFGVPTAGANVEIFPPGAVFVTGISPSVPNASTGHGRFFAGRTVLFTHTRKFSTTGTPPAPHADFNNRVLSTVVHEFLHAFGMPHKCGNWSWRAPRQKSCCMNYFDTWLLDAAHNLIPGTVRQQGDDMCGRHLMEVRRVHLDRNSGLNW